MCVVALRLIPHDQQVAVSQLPGPTLASCPVAQHEPSSISEADRCNGRSGTELGLVVTVIAHGVLAVPIEVGKAGIEINTNLAAKLLSQLCQSSRPCGRLIHDSGVAVGTVSHPRCESRGRHGAPIQRDGVLLPGNLLVKLCI